MTGKYWLRSTIFNLFFYVITGLACLILLPTLLMPRGAFLGVVHGWTWVVYKLEKYILGLDFEIRGTANIPDQGSFIVAAKHQSAYETMKLHTLFKDPAIILKQELLKIPFWGLYLKKIRPIAIDRSNKETAISSIQEGSLQVKDQNRPIVIFPQGTRVRTDHTTTERPYKIGVARIQESTQLPIVPLALNTGYFWPRSGWCKRPGHVIFEFLPAIEAGLRREELMRKLENDLEEHSNNLLKEAQEAKPKSRLGFAGLTLLLMLAYCGWWFYISGLVQKEHSLFLVKSEQVEMLAAHNTGKIERNFKNAAVSGFPGRITLSIEQEHFSSPTFQVLINDIKASSWPFPFMPIELKTGALSLRSFNMPQTIEMDSLHARFIPKGHELALEYAYIMKNDFEILASGTVLESMEGSLENVDIIITLKNVSSFLDYLKTLKVLDEQTLMFFSAGLNGFAKDGVVTIPVYLKDKNIFAGPFAIMRVP